MSDDLAAIVGDVQRLIGMLDWKIMPFWCTAEDMPIAGALAVCQAIPERSLAHIAVLTPWPANEDLRATIAHELTHALLSPLVALIQRSDASVMIEETIVEKLGNAIAAAPGLARAIARAVDRYAPKLRARLRARRETMDPEKIKAIIAALKEGNGEAALGLLEELLTAAVAPGAGASDPAPPAREDGAADDGKPPGDGYPREEEPGKPMSRAAARKGAAVSEHELRARRAADKSTGIYIRGRLAEVRRAGLALDAKLEAELAAMTDDEAFDRRIGDIERGRAIGAGQGQRARSGAVTEGAPPPADGTAPPMTAEQLKAEGASDQWISEYTEEHKRDPRAAAASLSGFRARRAQDANTNAWGKRPVGKG